MAYDDALNSELQSVMKAVIKLNVSSIYYYMMWNHRTDVINVIFQKNPEKSST